MADSEKKTYLVNIESNLNKYAEEAAEAKKKVDDLKITNDLLKKSGDNTSKVYQENSAQLKNAQKEYRSLQKVVEQQLILDKKESTYRDKLVASRTIEIQKLKELGSGYIKNAQGIDIVNPKLIQQEKIIGDLNEAIIQNDKSMNDGRTNVGRYGEAVSAAFKGAKESVMAMISPMALIASGMALAGKIAGELKDALMSTSKAIDTVNIYTVMLKQGFYDLVTSGKMSVAAMNEVAYAAQKMNEERRGDRKDMVEFALLEREIAMAEFEAADKTKTRTERMDALNRAIRLQNELSDKKLIDARQELAIISDLIKQAPERDDLRQQEAELIVRIINLDKERYEQNRRNETRLTTMMQEDIVKRKGMMDGWFAEIEADNIKNDEDEIKRAEDKEKKLLEIRKKSIEAHKAQEITAFNEATKFIGDEIKRMDAVADAEWKSQLELGKALFDQNQANAQIIWDAQREADKKELDQLELKEQRKQQLIQAGIQGAQQGADAIFNARTSRLNAEMTAELSNANLTESQKVEINKKYAKAQQKIDVTQAIINGALAIGNALATTKPFVPAALIAAAAAAVTTGIQVAVIRSQSFEGEGSTAPTSISASIPARTAFAAPVGSSFLNQPQLSQGQLNAIPNQNILTASDIANALKNLPPPVVTVEDINARTLSKQKIEVRANI